MRTEIIFKIICSICNKDLEADADNDKTKISFNSADNVTACIAIKPCERCYGNAKRPAQLIKQAIELI